MDTGIRAQIMRLAEIKGSSWNDEVGKSFDGFLQGAYALCERMENSCGKLLEKVNEVSVRTPLNELENAFEMLIRLFSEADI